MGRRRPVIALQRGRAVVIALAAAALPGGSATVAAADEHPWRELLPPSPTERVLPPLSITHADALDVSATLRAAPVRGEVGITARASYRLDAEDYLDRKRGDANDLDLLHGALRELARRDAVLTWFADRCVGAWRGWQVDLLARASPGREDEAEAAYLTALLGLLARTASAPATTADIGACRLDERTRSLALEAEAPEAVLGASEARLSDRASALAAAAPPATAWLEIDALASWSGPDAVSIRAGLDLPLSSRGPHVAVGMTAAGPAAAVSWRSASLDERIADRHRGDGGEPASIGASRAADFGRLTAEAGLARAEAELRWRLVCGGGSPETVIACLGRPTASSADRDALLAAVEAELTAIHARLALIAASGHALADVLRGGKAAALPLPP